MRTPALILFAALLTLGAAWPGVSSPTGQALEAQTYSLHAEGAVQVEAVSLPIGEDDPGVSDAAILSGAATERFVYSPDPIDSDSSIESGPYRIIFMVGPDHAAMEGQEAIAFQASLHLSHEVEPGEYEIEEGFFDVGPNAVPVAAMAVAVSPDRSFQLPMTEIENGWLRLSEFGDTASGSFEFTGVEMDGDRTITVRGAFEDAPMVPMSELEENQ